MSVLVYLDSKNGEVVKSAHEALSYGRSVADKMGVETHAVTYGISDQSSLNGLGAHGAQHVHVFQNLSDFNEDALVSGLSSLVDEHAASVVIFAHDFGGKAIAPRVAAKKDAGFVSGAVALPELDNGFVVKSSVFSGKAFAMNSIKSDVKVVAVNPNSFGVKSFDGEAAVHAIDASTTENRIKVEEFTAKGGGGILLTEADLVVSGGRGLKGPENWGMVEELANALGAATACSRPVADSDWRPHHEHVGQTGVAIRPNLYIAIGISGAIQHLAGVNASKVIVVINTDPEAPFFKAADYGIVGDAFEVVPKLVEAAKKFKEASA